LGKGESAAKPQIDLTVARFNGLTYLFNPDMDFLCSTFTSFAENPIWDFASLSCSTIQQKINDLTITPRIAKTSSFATGASVNGLITTEI